MSADGKYQLIAASPWSSSEGDTWNQVWRSVDYGLNWMGKTFDPWTREANWLSVAVSQAGDTMMAGSLLWPARNGYPGRTWVSFDFGGKFQKMQPNGVDSDDWRGLSCSYHGTHMLACNTNQYPTLASRLWATNNGGKSWQEERPAGDVDAIWFSSCLSELGDTAVVAAHDGRMWIGLLPAVPVAAFTSCYWDTDTSGQATSAGTAVGKTTAQMETTGTFVDWDFTNVWNEPDGCYPWLRTEHVAVRDGCATTRSFPWLGKFQLSHVTA
jgi:hypothetical protein